jgi:rhodanese-related sulfurtransferase
MKRLATVLLCCGLTGCAGLRIAPVMVREAAPAEAAVLVSQSRAIVLDVSYPEDYGRAHIPGAISIPKSQVWYRIDDLGAGREDAILVYDARGERSHEAAMRLVDEGYENVYELTGGLEAWTATGLPLSGDAIEPHTL